MEPAVSLQWGRGGAGRVQRLLSELIPGQMLPSMKAAASTTIPGFDTREPSSSQCRQGRRALPAHLY